MPTKQTYHGKNGRFTSYNSAHTVNKGGERFRVVRNLEPMDDRDKGGDEPESSELDGSFESNEAMRARRDMRKFLSVSPGWTPLSEVVKSVFSEDSGAKIGGFTVPSPAGYQSRKDPWLSDMGKLLDYMDDQGIKINKTNLKKFMTFKKENEVLEKRLGMRNIRDSARRAIGGLDDSKGYEKTLKDYKRQLAKLEKESDVHDRKVHRAGRVAPRVRISDLTNISDYFEKTRELQQKIADLESFLLDRKKRVKVPRKKRSTPKVQTRDEYLGQHRVSGWYADFGLHSRGMGQVRGKSGSGAVFKRFSRKSHEFEVEKAKRSKEYDEKVKAGEIRPPTYWEELIAKASGLPEKRSVQAAKRLLAKYEKKGLVRRKSDGTYEFVGKK